MRYEQAKTIATAAHSGQKRRGDGADYITHPIWVAEQFDDEQRRVVGILHDTPEDTSFTIDQLKEEGLGEVEAEALELVTRKQHPDGRNEVYMSEFIERIATTPGEAGAIARDVKRADLEHNRRSLLLLPESERGMEQRYERADRRLERAQREFGEPLFVVRELRPQTPDYGDSLSL